MRRIFTTLNMLVITCSVLAAAPKGDDAAEAVSQADKAATILNEVMSIPEDTIPEGLLADAECVAVFPSVVKAAFVFGGTGGRGLVSFRNPKTRRWGPPVFLKVGGGSWGLQIGADSTDFVLIGMNKESRDVFLKNEWTLGTEVAVTGGPVGRRAKAGTSWKLTAGLLSYSRSKGLFAGVSLEGGKVKVDDKLTAAVYGNASVADILYGKVAPAAESAGVKVYPEGLAKYDRSVKRR